MSTLIEQESFDRYAALVRLSVPNAVGVALCDIAGQPIQLAEFDSSVGLSPAIEQLCKRHPDWVSGLQCCRPLATPGDGQFLATTGLCDVHGEKIAALAVLLPGDAQQQSDGELLATLTECIEHELALESELEAMTSELTERYEELNLVYHTEDQVNYFRQGRQALQKLTQNCLDYLDVDQAILILKDKRVTITCKGPSNPIPNGHLVTAHLADRLYSWVKENNETIVINTMSDSLGIRLLPGVPYRVICSPILDGAGEMTGILATINNYAKPAFSNSDKNLLQVMARKAAKIVVANYDALTGLINRNGYEYYLESALAEVRDGEDQKSLLHINIDQLHIINDTAGHAAGDEVIRSIAATIASEKRDADTLSRLGGDEFGVLLHECSFSDAAEFAERIRRAVEESSVTVDGACHKSTVSIGAAMMTANNSSVAQVIGAAELACAVAKDYGQNRVESYRPDNVDMARREEQMHMVAQIQSALAEDRFELYCQPIQALTPNARDYHTEILLRLLDKNDETLRPGSFIPAAERYHLMSSVDRWVVSKTMSMLSQFDNASLRNGTFAINLSGQSLNEKDFLEFMHEQIEISGVPPECLCFEVTETAAITDLSKAILFMSSLKKIGCAFALDDFGSGISSFGYLKSLPVDFLKIDGSFVKDMVTDATSAAMVTAINQVGQAMNLRTIAEFVENDAIVSMLKKIGVDYAQGYGIGKPEPFAGRLREMMDNESVVAS